MKKYLIAAVVVFALGGVSTVPTANTVPPSSTFNLDAAMESLAAPKDLTCWHLVNECSQMPSQFGIGDSCMNPEGYTCVCEEGASGGTVLACYWYGRKGPRPSSSRLEFVDPRFINSSRRPH